ncbi:hemerythrin domain-containing protein [Nocardia colli]|uniref:Hemerythrin domain-containing protein n=1 Tax=Nocardia colli TaxID=2545717 RepID=A0A5N0E2U3_9NOCA|nr:hemerythrin domain-containing protein [Nocardia colli]KAA8882051.1 hemerythrin domain-containing protein [Nocardia colli]
MSTDPHRARALGRELIDTHHWLRSELRRVARALDEYRGDEPIGPLRDLRAHCLAFCQALTDHHTSEDETAFPVLAQRFPDLAPVLAELSADHHLVADILNRMTAALAELGAENLAAVRGEIAGLSAILESHFQWEERRITAALDELPGAEYTAAELFSANRYVPGSGLL